MVCKCLIEHSSNGIFALYMHVDIALNGCECMSGKSTLSLVFYWMGLVKWDNVQQSHTVDKMEKKICIEYQQVGIDPPLGERPINYGQT